MLELIYFFNVHVCSKFDNFLYVWQVRTVMAAQGLSLVAVCISQYINTMILGSLVMSFIPATFLLMYFRVSVGVDSCLIFLDQFSTLKRLADICIWLYSSVLGQTFVRIFLRH